MTTGIDWQSAICDLSNVLDEERKITIFRVIQACLNHLLTHMNIQEVILSIELINQSVKVDIKDDGIIPDEIQEFNVDSDINNIKRRIRLFDGSFYKTLEPDGGCHLSFSIPL